MSLSLKISKKAGGRADMIASRSWPQNRITVGRGEECTLVLEDPKKHVSRVHVEFEERDEHRFQLTVVSKVNPAFVNGKRHAPGSTLELRAGDRVEIGEYELELLPPPSQAPRSEAPVPEAEETTRPDNPMLRPPRSKPAAAPAPPKQQKPVPVEPARAAPPPPPPPPPPPAPAPAPDVVFEEATFLGQKLPPIEPGFLDEPAVAEAP